ncbi:hypothetical protein [Thalassovita sp.]|uniref:hypothetical protein n=1 Tax=Thalassovita sp. TaxID=1979401 RepID=UPI0028821500|nr:hypothetical protein [Thalassovita sp.]MDF1804058.1 hypothetical protein [Thalassovita sp.]
MSNIDLSLLVTAEQKQTAYLANVKEAALVDLIRWINETTHAITGPVPEDEKLSWVAKEQAARAVLGGDATIEQTDLIAAEAQIGGEDASDLATKIVANADQYRGAISVLTGLRRKAMSEIEEADDIQDTQEAVNVAKATWLAVQTS